MTAARDRWLFGHWCENQRKRIQRTLEQFGRPVQSTAHRNPLKPTADEQANRLRPVTLPYSRDEDVEP